MDMAQACPNCGKALVPGAPQGLCPECLMKSGFDTKSGGTAGGGKGDFVPPPADWLAKLFTQLEIIELLGYGGMGAVYKARQPRLNRFVALKILSPEKQSDPQFAERFEREARALAALTHPNIVAVYDFGQAQGIYYLVMEFVDGPTLRQLYQARKLSPAEALKIVPKICEALEYAHQEGVVHRDIKPENILLDRKGQVKIADFGIAKIIDLEAKDLSLTGAKDIVGTLHYMAPEQVEKPQEVDHRADIYSLGVVFYEMLTGELPLGKFQPPSEKVQIDVRLDEVVLHALEKEPERRYQTAQAVKTDVETIATTPGGGVPPIQPTEAGSAAAQPILRKSNRWKFAAVIAGLGVVAVLLITALIALATLLIGVKPSALPRKGLVAWWRADGNANDSVNSNNGTLLGELGFTAGGEGQAFNFVNGTQGVLVNASSTLAVQSITIECWINPEDVINLRPIVEYGADTGRAPVQFLYGWNDPGGTTPGALFGLFRDANGGGLAVNSPGHILPVNQWSHVALTYDCGSCTAKLYLNGTNVGSSVYTTSLNLQTSLPVHIGYRPDTSSEGYAGTRHLGGLDEVGIYNRALSQSEIQAIFNAGAASKCSGAHSNSIPTPGGLMAAGTPKQTAPPKRVRRAISWWRAGGNALDSTRLNNGELTNGVKFANGISGKCFRLDGKGAYVKIPQSPSLNFESQLTIEFWMKADPRNNMDSCQGLVTSDFYFVEISNGRNGTMGVNFGISTDGRTTPAWNSGSVGQEGSGIQFEDSKRLERDRSPSQSMVTVTGYTEIADANGGGAPVSSDEWHDIVGTYDGTKLQLYIDGKPWGEPVFHTGTIRPMLPESFVAFGSEDGRKACPDCIGKRYFNGLIDEVKVYNVALTPGEIARNYQAMLRQN